MTHTPPAEIGTEIEMLEEEEDETEVAVLEMRQCFVTDAIWRMFTGPEAVEVMWKWVTRRQIGEAVVDIWHPRVTGQTVGDLRFKITVRINIGGKHLVEDASGLEGVVLQILNLPAEPDVIWLPRTKLEPAALLAARRKAETIPGHRGVALKGDQLGIRVPKDNFVNLLQEVLGEEEAARVIKSTTGKRYQIVGAPWSMQEYTLTRLAAKMGWPIEVVTKRSAGRQGRIWTVVADGGVPPGTPTMWWKGHCLTIEDAQPRPRPTYDTRVLVPKRGKKSETKWADGWTPQKDTDTRAAWVGVAKRAIETERVQEAQAAAKSPGPPPQASASPTAAPATSSTASATPAAPAATATDSTAATMAQLALLMPTLIAMADNFRATQAAQSSSSSEPSPHKAPTETTSERATPY